MKTKARKQGANADAAPLVRPRVRAVARVLGPLMVISGAVIITMAVLTLATGRAESGRLASVAILALAALDIRLGLLLMSVARTGTSPLAARRSGRRG